MMINNNIIKLFYPRAILHIPKDRLPDCTNGNERQGVKNCIDIPCYVDYNKKYTIDIYIPIMGVDTTINYNSDYLWKICDTYGLEQYISNKGPCLLHELEVPHHIVDMLRELFSEIDSSIEELTEDFEMRISELEDKFKKIADIL